jgi:hypothetical protein
MTLRLCTLRMRLTALLLGQAYFLFFDGAVEIESTLISFWKASDMLSALGQFFCDLGRGGPYIADT